MLDGAMSWVGLVSYFIFLLMIGISVVRPAIIGSPDLMPFVLSIVAGVIIFYVGYRTISPGVVNLILTCLGWIMLGLILFCVILTVAMDGNQGRRDKPKKDKFISELDALDREELLEKIQIRMDMGDTREKMMAARVRLARKGAYTSAKKNEVILALVKGLSFD